MSELELEGDEDICTQLMKLSEDNSNDPEQELFEVLVVTEVESIASEKVTEMLSLTETPLWLSAG
jgi:ubiquinone biosynthesis protein UbiJ